MGGQREKREKEGGDREMGGMGEEKRDREMEEERGKERERNAYFVISKPPITCFRILYRLFIIILLYNRRLLIYLCCKCRTVCRLTAEAC